MATMLERAQEFMWTNARLLDRQSFAALFADGPQELVVQALLAYQNPDGGFGNALEPDKRDPHSQPVDAETALHILDDLGAEDGWGATEADLLRDLCDWLAAHSTAAGGVPFALPTVNDYPRAPWWQADADPPASLNPTAAIAGLLYKFGVRHPWLEQATAYCWQAISDLNTDEFHTLMPVITFLENVPDRARAEQEWTRLATIISAPGVVEHDPAAEGYQQKPLDWAPTPERWTRRLFTDEQIAQHLKALAARQEADGGWPINWEPISAAVATEWRGWVTIHALQTLRAYGVPLT